MAEKETIAGGGSGERRGMSLTTGALVLRSVSRFLARGRAAAAAAAAREAAQSAPVRRRAMSQPNKLPPKTIDALKRKTHFNKSEIEGLYSVYRKLLAISSPGREPLPGGAAGAAGATAGAVGVAGAAGGGVKSAAPKLEGIDQNMFRDVLHNTFDLVTEEVLVDRIFSVWDRQNEGAIRFDSWSCGLSVFLRGTVSEKIVHCFNVYDLNSDGYITKDEMFLLLKNCLLKQPGDEDPDEGVRDLVELVLKKLDVDKDGKISFEDYQESIKREPLLLEAFGQCLPANAECITFMETIQT